MQRLRRRDSLDLVPFLAHDVGELLDALVVGTARAADINRLADLEHVASVERTGQLDPVQLEPGKTLLDSRLDGANLRLARLGAGGRDHGHVAKDDNRVFDEHAVGARVVARHRDQRPLALGEDLDIVRPLLLRLWEGDIGGRGNVRDLALREGAGGRAHEEDRHGEVPWVYAEALVCPSV